MGSRNRSRRSVLKTGAALASVGVVGSLSGCSGMLSDDGDTADGDSGADGAAGDIPARSSVAMSMSFDAVLEDQAVRGAVNNALSSQSDSASMLPSSVSEAFGMVEEESGVDPRKLNDVVLFGESSDDGDESEYVGWLVYTDWSQAELQSYLDEKRASTPDGETASGGSYGDVTTEEYGGTTVYVNEDMDDSTERMAILSDGTVVLGRAGATNDVIDIRNGDGDAISGELLSAWEAASGEYATIAMDITPEDLPDGQAEAAAPTVRNIEYVYGSVYADGDKRGVRFNLETGSEQDAEDVKAFLDGQMALEEDTAEDPQTEAMLDNTEITTAGTTVVITNEVDIDTITPAIEQFVTLFVAEQSARATAGSSVTF